jgi:hypothetical protein
MIRMQWIAFLAFALASAPVQGQGYQGGPGSRGLDGLNGNRPGPGIMGGDPMGSGPPFGGRELWRGRITPDQRGWKPPGIPDDIQVPQINQEALRQEMARSLNQRFDGFPFSGSRSEKRSSQWPAWVRWEGALGLFAASFVIGLLIGRFGKSA